MRRIKFIIPPFYTQTVERAGTESSATLSYEISRESPGKFDRRWILPLLKPFIEKNIFISSCQ